MFYKNNFYIYLDARAGISHWEDFQITDTPESFRISGRSLALYKIPLKVIVLGFIFSNFARLHYQSLLRNKHLLRYIFKTSILRTPVSLKNM